jgi:hypothetical protein
MAEHMLRKHKAMSLNYGTAEKDHIACTIIYINKRVKKENKAKISYHRRILKMFKFYILKVITYLCLHS